eukprot:TRINITY_DN47248_c0_g1_i1.p1 TRINITY_DN47248_c0_g1~~TRINITY_DN47248_c0_g1_i1.p1  ORF type:complete len:1302 (+),score=374.96 TRINITY_DN47248_c0_g1_i1:108-3908(+)
MLEPTAIHSYDPPLYRTLPPSPESGLPHSLPFTCVVLEATGVEGGPSPKLLHELRSLGCRLVLARDPASESRAVKSAAAAFQAAGRKGSGGSHAAPLHETWYGAVFDKVIDRHGVDHVNLERYLSSTGVGSDGVVCFCSTPDGARAFAAAEAGLIVGTSQSLCDAGADVAVTPCPTARQLMWLHQMYTGKKWCTCLWLLPPPGELAHHPGDDPPAAERAELTSLGSALMSARGHPSWVLQRKSDPPPCLARLGGGMVPCPDWTPLIPFFGEQKVCSFQHIKLYSHTLDVGVAQVSFTLEAVAESGLAARLYSRRVVNLARGGQGATEIAVKVDALPEGQPCPKIVVRSSLLLCHVPQGFSLGPINVQGDKLSAVYVEDTTGRTIHVQACHRLVKDEGRGDELVPTSGEEAEAHIQPVPGTDVTVDVTFLAPRKHARYIVEKTVTVCTDGARGMTGDSVSQQPSTPESGTLVLGSSAAAVPSNTSLLLRRRTAPNLGGSIPRTLTPGGGLRRSPEGRLVRQPSLLGGIGGYDGPPSLAETEDEHRFAWKQEWDKVDIELGGGRCATCCQRALRLFRFQQASRGEHLGSGELNVPDAVVRRFQQAFAAAAARVGSGAPARPSALIASRLSVISRGSSPLAAEPPGRLTEEGLVVVRVEPAIPPAWDLMRFNAALGGRWYRFTLTPGLVKILMQSPTLDQQSSPILTRKPPIFRISSDSGEDPGRGVEIQAAPWREVQVRHALTDLGRPDGSSGGFYGLMRRTRFLRLEIVRRLFGEDHGDFRDPAIVMPLRTALSELESVPRPPAWHHGDDEALHVLSADATTRAQVTLGYEKGELVKDICFLEKGEMALIDLLRQQHKERFKPGTRWVEPGGVPDFDTLIQRAAATIRRAVIAAAREEDGAEALVFRNFITDRDGTTNNYCDRYSSSVQSAYNAAFLGHFGRHCVENSVFVTAAPLGGRPSAQGLMELSVNPPGVFTYTGSKGREFFDHASQRVRESEHLPATERELVDEVFKRLSCLCAEPNNVKFLGLGSGLQRKFGEVTMARNDPAGTVPEPESRRFMAAVRAIKDEIDPDGSALDLHDTGTDMEIFTRRSGGKPFNKGDGVACLDRKLHLRVADGPNLVCGDTASDVPMIETAIRLMCIGHGDWSGTPMQLPQEHRSRVPVLSQPDSPSISPGARLAVLFVISPEQHRKTPELAKKVRELCESVGAHCLIVPSPDVLVCSLNLYAQQCTKESVTGGELMDKQLQRQPNQAASPVLSMAQIYCH